MNEEQNKEQESIESTEEQVDQIPVFDSEDFLKVLEHIEKELKSEKVFRTSRWWYISLLIQIIFYYGIGISLLTFLEPFKLANNYIVYIYLGISALLCCGVKVYTHVSSKPLVKMTDSYLNYGLSLVLSIVVARYLPGILDIDYVLLIIYILVMLIVSDNVSRFVKKYIRGSYEKNK